MGRLKELPAMLVCPRCRGPLEYVETEDRLDCKSCRLGFRVIDGIPVLLIEGAEELKQR